MSLKWDCLREPEFARLSEILRDMDSVLVAFSGGTDSAFLAAAAHHLLGTRALMVTAVSPTLPPRDLDDATRLAATHGWRHMIVESHELDNPRFTANPPDRCYHCKAELCRQLTGIAHKEGLRWVADGSNLDDRGDYRPGARARDESGVRSPLLEARCTKAAIREMSRQIGLDTADKPSSACLASRFPYGVPITAQGLQAVARAEAELQALGFEQVRVRVHGDIARVELHPADIPRASTEPLRQRIAAALHTHGFRYVALDLEGYRLGSMNEALPLARTDNSAE